MESVGSAGDVTPEHNTKRHGHTCLLPCIVFLLTNTYFTSIFDWFPGFTNLYSWSDSAFNSKWILLYIC